MSEQAAFLRAIIDEPDELAHRLVYADWLDDHDDPERAEFIRAQCRLDRFHRTEEPFLVGVPDSALGQEHARAWLAPLLEAGLTFSPSSSSPERPFAFRFRRGFVEGLTVRLPTAFVRPARLFSLTPLLHIQFTGQGYGERFVGPFLGPFLRCPDVARLRTLDLGGLGLGAAGARALLDSPHLTPATRIFFEGNRLLAEPRLALEARFGASISCDPNHNPDDDIPF